MKAKELASLLLQHPENEVKLASDPEANEINQVHIVVEAHDRPLTVIFPKSSYDYQQDGDQIEYVNGETR